MPWNQTEELFKSTLKAAIAAAPPNDNMSKDPKVIDLGEAGSQEIWQSGSMCIQKTIAKHGGKRLYPGFWVRSNILHPALFMRKQATNWQHQIHLPRKTPKLSHTQNKVLRDMRGHLS